MIQKPKNWKTKKIWNSKTV